MSTDSCVGSASSCSIGPRVISVGGVGGPPDFFVKGCCQLGGERSPRLVVSACMGGTATEREQAWEITWERVPNCAAILGPRKKERRKGGDRAGFSFSRAARIFFVAASFAERHTKEPRKEATMS